MLTVVVLVASFLSHTPDASTTPPSAVTRVEYPLSRKLMLSTDCWTFSRAKSSVFETQWESVLGAFDQYIQRFFPCFVLVRGNMTRSSPRDKRVYNPLSRERLKKSQDRVV